MNTMNFKDCQDGDHGDAGLQKAIAAVVKYLQVCRRNSEPVTIACQMWPETIVGEGASSWKTLLALLSAVVFGCFVCFGCRVFHQMTASAEAQLSFKSSIFSCRDFSSIFVTCLCRPRAHTGRTCRGVGP